MGLYSAQLAPGLSEIHEGFQREGSAVILGRPVPVVIPLLTRRHKNQQSDFVGLYELTMRVRLTDFTGLDPEKALETEVSFEGKRYRIKEHQTNEVRIYFGLESLSA